MQLDENEDWLMSVERLGTFEYRERKTKSGRGREWGKRNIGCGTPFRFGRSIGSGRLPCMDGKKWKSSTDTGALE